MKGHHVQIPVLQLQGIHKSFTGHQVLRNISLSVNPGEVLCLVGENGCGKSTLIKIISGVYQPDAGLVSFHGKIMPRLDPVLSIRQGVQVIYQDFSVFPNLSVAENVALGAQLAQGGTLMRWNRARIQARDALGSIGVEMDLEAEVGSLSVAQKQIIAIARAIVQQAKLIIMDEPTTALTGREIECLYGIIRALSGKGVAVIFVSHKLDEVFAIYDRVAVLRSGELVVDAKAGDFEQDRLVYYMTGQEIRTEPFIFQNCGKPPALEVRGLSRPGTFTGITFSVYPGEILGITGQLGSGRTELAKALFGIGKTTAGSLLVHGKERKFRGIRDAMHAGIGYVPEDRLTEGLFLQRSLRDNFSATTVDRKKTRRGFVNFAKMDAEAALRVRQLGINAGSIHVNAGTFSGGNQQRVVIGKWLAANPDILILNGPTVGVDVKSKRDIHDILKDLALQGLCILLISDDVGELLTCTNRILVMSGGRIVYETQTSMADRDTLNAQILRDTRASGVGA
jgi:simple sugar transport system ATP-binding protein